MWGSLVTFNLLMIARHELASHSRFALTPSNNPTNAEPAEPAFVRVRLPAISHRASKLQSRPRTPDEQQLAPDTLIANTHRAHAPEKVERLARCIPNARLGLV